MTNSVDPDQMLHSVASDLDLHNLLRSVSPNTKSKYGKPNLTDEENRGSTESQIHHFSKLHNLNTRYLSFIRMAA